MSYYDLTERLNRIPARDRRVFRKIRRARIADKTLFLR